MCGVSIVVQNLAEGLARMGHKVTVLTGKTATERLRKHNNVEILEFDVEGNWAKGFHGETKAYLNYILNIKDGVLINECSQNWCTDLLFPYLDKIRVSKILHSHGFSWLDIKARRPYLRWRQYLYYKTLWKYLRKYDHVIYLTNVLEDKVYGDSHGITKYTVCGNGVDDMFFKPQDLTSLRIRYNLKRPIILTVGAFSPLKGQEFVLRAFYKSRAIKHELCLVGNSNSYLNRLQKLKKKLNQKYGKRQVRFFPNIPRADVVAFFQKADLFLFGSRREAFPLVIAEAMATGTPYISTPVGNIAYLLGGFTVKTEQEMATRNDQLIEDSAKREWLGREGKSYAEKELRWDYLIRKFEGVIQQVYGAKA